MKQENDLTGNLYQTKGDGILKVLSIKGVNKSKETVYEVTCDKCSFDKDLFPFGIEASERQLKSKVAVCGCSKHKVWSEQQNKVRVERKCEELSYEFHGWAEKYRGAKTKLILYNPHSGNTWKGGNMNNFLNRGTKDPKESREAVRMSLLKPQEDFIDKFLRVSDLEEGTIFCKIDKLSTQGSKPYWLYKCKVCSVDKYTVNGLCNGIFETTAGRVHSNSLPCRCSERPHLTKNQREYDIKIRCSENNYKFLGWIDKKYEGKNTTFKWLCPNDHLCTSSILCFLTLKNGCRRCRENNAKLGYYPDMLERKDYLYLYFIGGCASYLKVGRSFTPSKRLKENQSKIDSFYGDTNQKITVLFYAKGTHEKVYEVEQRILDLNFRLNRKKGYGSIELLEASSSSLISILKEVFTSSLEVLEQDTWPIC